MKVAVLCEFSGVVRDAFIARGHDAVSCDLLPTESPGPHIQGDCLSQDWSGYDIIVAHPPCTRLTVRGRYRGTRAECEEGEAFFMAMTRLPANRIAIENPKGVMSTIYRPPDQVVHPWQFGHRERKATCLWLIGLPRLIPTKQVLPEDPVHRDTTTGKRRYSLDYLPESPERWKIRSRTFPGIAAAMAEQWESFR